MQFLDKLNSVPFSDLSVNTLTCLVLGVPAACEPREFLDNLIGVRADGPRLSNRKIVNDGPKS